MTGTWRRKNSHRQGQSYWRGMIWAKMQRLPQSWAAADPKRELCKTAHHWDGWKMYSRNYCKNLLLLCSGYLLPVERRGKNGEGVGENSVYCRSTLF